MEENRPLGWTTVEESERLAEAGLDPNTADMYMINEHAFGIWNNLKYDDIIDFAKQGERDKNIYPCWSLGALIGLIPKSIGEHNLCITFEKGCPMVFYIDRNGGLLKLGDRYPYYRADGYIVCDSVVEMCVWAVENGYIPKN